LESSEVLYDYLKRKKERKKLNRYKLLCDEKCMSDPVK